MSVMLCTLCLNEMEFLPKLYEQHKNWPGVKSWVFVEAADVAYAAANPGFVSPQGLSVDGTTQFLEDLAKKDAKVLHIKHGFSSDADPAQGKCQARNRYLEIADQVCPRFLIQIDGDEFWTKADQHNMLPRMEIFKTRGTFIFNQRSIWHPPSVAREPLFKYESIGSLFGFSACRAWRWRQGMRFHGDHNHPTIRSGTDFYDFNDAVRLLEPTDAKFIHMGFASKVATRSAKTAYYIQRGEGVDPQRKRYVDCRLAFNTWKPGQGLPDKAKVVLYRGPIPEVYQ